MNAISNELFEVADRLEEVNKKGETPKISGVLDALESAADQVGKSWSGSFVGYQSRVYYRNLEPPPPGAHFSSEWGFKNVLSNDTKGQWEEHNFDLVQRTIREAAGHPDLLPAQNLAEEAREVFEDSQNEIVSILTVMLEERDDSVIVGLKKETKNLKPLGASNFAESILPKQYWSRDSLAMSQGLHVPPHLDILADVFAMRSSVQQCGELAKVAKRAASHAARRERRSGERREISKVSGKKIFIGHGGSFVWRDLKDFLQERLRLPWDEFNRGPVAGMANTERLSQMLDDAAMAFLVMTAEDEQKDMKMNARLNVVHEAGLFQGRLGFRKAIVLLEEGCEEFSNIQGLIQIRFPKGDISARFEKIREILEREELIK